ncbi:Cupredoxin [Mycena capillaripes]|nr:Cupredoxin [Mycena capillaripes]
MHEACRSHQQFAPTGRVLDCARWRHLEKDASVTLVLRKPARDYSKRKSLPIKAPDSFEKPLPYTLLLYVEHQLPVCPRLANGDVIGIRANPSAGTKGFAGGINSAILRYVGAADADPTSTQGVSTNAFVEANMRPLTPVSSGDPAKSFNFVISATGGKFAMNNVSFVPPTTPVLLQILSGKEDAQSLLPTGSVFPIPKDSVIQVSIPGGGQHPFHLHGHAFDVVRSAGSSVYNFINPPRRDVVSVGNAGDNVTIRFVTDNDGPWFLHCHIDWHLEAGLAIVFAEDVPDWNTTIAHSTAWDDLCPTYDALGASDL